MKREHIFVTLWSILLCFALWKLTSYEPKVTVDCNTEAKCECDTSEVVNLRKENKKLQGDLYWMKKAKNSCVGALVECNDTLEGDARPKIRFDKKGNLIKAI